MKCEIENGSDTFKKTLAQLERFHVHCQHYLTQKLYLLVKIKGFPWRRTVLPSKDEEYGFR